MITSWPPSDAFATVSDLILRPFPDSDSSGSIELSFSVARTSRDLHFVFKLTAQGPLSIRDDLLLPALKPPMQRRRRHELWKGTCFEIFVAPAHASPYLEMNLAPCGDWNLYGFDSYRSGMRELNSAGSPFRALEIDTPRDTIELRGVFSMPDLEPKIAEWFLARDLVLGSTAVMEYKSGRREYWALSHKGLQPDFHLRDSFSVALKG